MFALTSKKLCKFQIVQTNKRKIINFISSLSLWSRRSSSSSSTWGQIARYQTNKAPPRTIRHLQFIYDDHPALGRHQVSHPHTCMHATTKFNPNSAPRPESPSKARGLVHSQIKLNYCSFPHDSAVQQRAARVAIQELLLKFSPIQWAPRTDTRPDLPVNRPCLRWRQCSYICNVLRIYDSWSLPATRFWNMYLVVCGHESLSAHPKNPYWTARRHLLVNGTTTSAVEHILDHTAW